MKTGTAMCPKRTELSLRMLGLDISFGWLSMIGLFFARELR